MITLEKNTFMKISDDCGIAYIQDWGNPEGDCFYVAYVKTSEDADGLGEAFGKGQTAEEALVEAFKNLVCLGLESLPLSYIKSTDMETFLEALKTEKGHISQPQYTVMPIKHCCDPRVQVKDVEGNKDLENKYGFFIANTNVSCPTEQDNKVYPLLC